MQPSGDHPRRPPRLTQLFGHVRPFYFVTFNTHLRQSILAHDQVHESFVKFCTRAQENDIAVGRYVLMPDHVHLFVVFPPHGMTLPQWVRALRTVVGKRLLEIGHSKPHWQEGFFDHVLRSSESYSEKWSYVRMNPVRAGLCTEPGQWPYQGEIVSIFF
jgi:REP element-mobilizing transposase RayT